MDAVILLNKPAGITSFDAVRRCRRIFHEKKAGHTGTLDPEATGLMIILLGRYTKLLPYCAAQFKQYRATFSFGRATDTEDIWGNVTAEKEPGEHSQAELDGAAKAMTGDIMQVPPMYSAIKKDGRKLYEYARKGIEIEREARRITVSSLSVEKTGDNIYTMDACVSSGTYIRTLITDYAASLGELAAMTSLVRTGIDHLSLEQAVTFEQLENGEGLVRAADVIDQRWQRVPLVMEKKVRNGMALNLEGYGDQILFTDGGEPCAVYEKQEDGLYHCLRGLW
jgi:tRNA pseudouridine55 synthase